MTSYTGALFTPAEAAVLTQLPLKAVNNAIDKDIVPVESAPGRDPARRLRAGALLALALERQLGDFVVLEKRRYLFRAMVARPYMKDSSYGLVKIDLREPRRELAIALRCLRQIRSLVAKDPDIQGGDPVFKGTRVPVHLIANMSNEGASEAEIREAYPRLTSAMIRLAPLYAAAYPLRGRPRKTVRLDIAPSRTLRRPLSPPKSS